MVTRHSTRTRLWSVLTLLAFVVGGAVEPVLGQMWDGQVHHETASQASIHFSSSASGEHGHEDGGLTLSRQNHTPGHQHGTGGDHCTHVHGQGIATSISLELSPSLPPVYQQFQPAATSPGQSDIPPPPKA